MHGLFHPKSNTARVYISSKEGGRGLHSIGNVVLKEEQRLNSYDNRKTESDPLMAERKHLAVRKEPDEAAAWYEKALAQWCVRSCRHSSQISH